MANQPLYLNYILGRYFSTDEGPDQVLWFMHKKNHSVDDLGDRSHIKHVNIQEFNKELNLFEDDKSMTAYSEKASGLSELKISREQTGLVAAIILYNTREILGGTTMIRDLDSCPNMILAKMSKMKTVKRTLASILASLRRSNLGKRLTAQLAADDELGTPEFIDTLTNMKNIFASRDAHASKDKLGSSLPSFLTMPYTMEEEAWLKKQLHEYQSAYGEIPLGDEFIKEFVMFSYGVPLSKTFATRGYLTFLQRYRRVLEVQEGYETLNGKDQVCHSQIKISKSCF